MKTLDPESEPDADPAVNASPDYYMEGPYVVFTEAFLQRRGFCCRSGCRHCPYGFRGADNKTSGVGAGSDRGD